MTRRFTLALVLAAVVAAGAVALLASPDGTPDVARADAGTQQPASSRPTTPRSARTESQRRGPLGSGEQVVLAFGGDVHFEGTLAPQLAASPSGVLAPIAPTFRKADLAVVNLETAVTSGGAAASKDYTFRTSPAAFVALRAAGITAASMANNHGMDFGEQGLRDSLSAARRHRFPVIGIGLNGKQAYAPLRRVVNGQRIAVLAATQVLDDHLVSAWTAGPGKPGLASAKDVPRLLQAVRQTRRTSDTVVVFLHWGVELMECPTTNQRTLAHRLVRAGADVVVGGHAHRLQGVGRMGNALVGYGLGNFVWYGTSELSTRTGVLFVAVTGRRIDGYRWEPARIVDGVPRPLIGSERRNALASWQTLRGCTGLGR